jgi:alkylation response protein AidB-like acyl-CoA dehydrogenase
MNDASTTPLEAPADRARSIADTVLSPRAQETDTADLVPIANLDALRDAGLNGLQGPSDVAGGLAAGHAEARAVFAAVAGGCGATAFVWAQHHGAVRRLTGSDGPGRDRWLPALCDGSVRAGIGFAYLRRPGPAAVRAIEDGTGWRLEGEAPWITGWGLADVFLIMARADDGRVVSGVVDRPYERADVIPGPPQRLSVMRSTGTVAVRFDGVKLDHGNVAGVQPADAWELRDRIGSAMPAPAPLGIAARAISLLRGPAERSETVADAMDRLAQELGACESSADKVSRAVSSVGAGPDDDVESTLALGAAERDRGLDLARRATDALVAASGGGAMDLAHPAQRLSREATFYLIQAQTGALRESTLARLLATRST